jgi:hypothetical protein
MKTNNFQTTLPLFECTHFVNEECFTTNPEGNWSPYFVTICIKCGKVSGYPSEEWLKTWPAKDQERLKRFIKYGRSPDYERKD